MGEELPQVLPNPEDIKKPFWDHLIELRSRLIRSFLAWVLGSIICYIYSDKILSFLLIPLKFTLNVSETVVYFKTLPEVFALQIKLSIIVGFILTSPYIFYQMWLFVAPGLYLHEKNILKLILFLSSLSFLIGVSLSYYLFLPALIKYLYTFGENFLVFKPYLKEYVNFVLKFFLFVGLLFQLPTSIFILTKISIIEVETLKKIRPYVIIISFFLSAIFTSSPDPVYQILLGLSLTILYEVGILLAKI